MDNAQTDKLVIEQRHREAADAWKRDWQNCRGEHTALVQAFARFERDHMAHHEAEITAAVERALDAAAEYHDRIADEAQTSWNAAREEGLEFANSGQQVAAEHRRHAAAIRQQKDTRA